MQCNTTIGLPGTLAMRLQPNDPTDSIDGIMPQIMEGLSYGIGDAVIGINPVNDDRASRSPGCCGRSTSSCEKWGSPPSSACWPT